MYSSNVKEGTVSELKGSTRAIKDDLQKTANQAGRKIRSLYNTASDEFSHASEKVTSEIRTNPVRSSIIAMGVGVLLGALLRR